MLKFAEHFAFISAAMDRIGENHDELWDEEDGFFYDVLRLPDGQRPAAQGALDGRAAAAVRDDDPARRRSGPRRRHGGPPTHAASTRCPSCSRRSTTPASRGVNGRRMLAVLDETKLRRVLARMLDEDEFLSPYGLASAVALPPRAPVPLRRARPDLRGALPARRVGQRDVRRQLELARARSGSRSTTSILRGLLHLYAYYGDDFKVECPTGSGARCTLFEVAEELGRRLVSIFVPDENGRRPVCGGAEKFQTDPALEGPPPLLRVLPRRQRRRGRRQPPDGMDRPRREDDPGDELRASGGPPAGEPAGQPAVSRQIRSFCRSRVIPFVVGMRPAVSWP